MVSFYLKEFPNPLPPKIITYFPFSLFPKKRIKRTKKKTTYHAIVELRMWNLQEPIALKKCLNILNTELEKYIFQHLVQHVGVVHSTVPCIKKDQEKIFLYHINPQ